MLFKNLTLFRFPAAVDFSELETLLPAAALKPVGPMEVSSRGFIPPFGQCALVERVGDAILLSVRFEDRILPSSVVNDLLQKKISQYVEATGRNPSSRMRRRTKDDLIAELLPRALVRPSRLDALIDLKHKVIAVDTPSRRKAEAVVYEVRRALGSFPTLPLHSDISVRAALSEWLVGYGLPDGLSVGEECELRDPSDSGAVVKLQRMELSGEELQTHLEAGKQVSRLALRLDNRVDFVLGEDLVIRKFRLLDGAIDTLGLDCHHEVFEELKARCALMAGEFSRLFAVLEKALYISKAD